LGGLAWASGAPAVYFYNSSTNAWSKLATTIALGGTWHLAEYNPVHKVVIFYSADTHALFKLSASGQITRLKDPTVSLYNGSNGLLTVDPASGDYLALTGSTLAPYKYDVQTDAWQPLSSTNAPNFNGLGVLGSVVNNYGVIMFTACSA